MSTWHSAFSHLHRKPIFVLSLTGYMLQIKTVALSMVASCSKSYPTEQLPSGTYARCSRLEEPIRFLMPGYKTRNNRLRAVDSGSRTTRTWLLWHVSVVQEPYALTTRRYIRISVTPNSLQSREGACIKTQRTHISSDTTIVVLEATENVVSGDHSRHTLSRVYVALTYGPGTVSREKSCSPQESTNSL